MKRRNHSTDHHELFSGELYLFHRIDRSCSSTGSLFGIFDKIADGIIYLESSSRDLLRFRLMKKYLLFLTFAATIMTGCGKDDTGGGSGAAVSEIRLNETNLSLAVGETFRFTATILPENASDKTVTWNSSDHNAATVDDGLVTAS